MTTPALKGNEHLYDLKGQTDHKAEFIERFIPKNINVYLIGHSVGAKVCLDLIKNLPQFSQQVQHVYLMFPTIEFIADSKKGKGVPAFDRIFFLVRMFYYSLHYLFPVSWKRALVNWHCRRDGMDEEFFETSLEYTNPRVIDKIWFMALDEMEKIREIDEENIKSNIKRVKLYYGSKDDWVPTEFYHEIVKRFPGIDAELCKNEYEHAFVLKTGREVGKMVSEWINQKRMIKS
jgi:pimeloyl-ACP methyl ester carboxylesterase